MCYGTGYYSAKELTVLPKRTITVTDPHGYFDTRIAFPGSGTVRLSYTYPSDDPLLSPGDTVFSRNVGITLK